MKLYVIASLFFGLLSGGILAQSISYADNVTSTTDDDNVTSTTPVETTTNSVESTTTTILPTPVPTPGPSKPPQKGSWVFKEENTNRVCLRLDAAIQLHFKYEQTNKKYVDAYLNVPPNATDDESSCGENYLSLSFDNTTFSLRFALENDKVFLKQANLTYLVSADVFPGAKDLGPHSTFADNLTLFEASKGKSYLCKEASTITFTPNITATFTDIQAEAFKNSTSEDFSSAEECSADKISDIVPIAVGCALAALVIIVLIAYLVGRQRTRQRGYQSV